MRSSWIIGGAPKFNEKCPYKREAEGGLRQTEGEDGVKREAEIEVLWPQAMECGSYQKLEEARKDSPLEPLEQVRPCQHLDFRLLTSRTVREKISAALSHQVCGILLSQPQEASLLTNDKIDFSVFRWPAPMGSPYVEFVFWNSTRVLHLWYLSSSAIFQNRLSNEAEHWQF